MPVVKNGTVYYVQQPADLIVPGETVKYVEEEIDLDNVPLNGGVLLKTVALSSDPYMRYRMREPDSARTTFCPVLKLNKPVDNFGVATVLRSEDPNFKAGDFVDGFINFQEYSIWPPPADQMHFLRYITKIDRPASIPASVYTGTLGLAGKTGFIAFDVFGKEKAKTSKTVFVSGGAGAVGTFVCEYAKICNPNIKVIASAGSPEKIKILKDIGVDVAINYKEEDVEKVLREHGPIDIYWDNVAGPTLDAALVNMNSQGVIIACGAISAASKNGEGSAVKHFEEIFERSLTVHGFTVGTGPSAAALPRFYDVVTPLFLEGKITSREHRFTLKQTGEALASVHLGSNLGKAVIVVSEDA
ncbi:NADP-dependent oxidoreductase [Phanerochaete sordida]|uniref:NADP-dependent oxidoreductase n=1 Tax=Phanerochaete sordida TaxID=48140 RepID=A0A9P3LGL6_9APHY|nr:NADP-dependent oxidoreductase [Phanerochaete sordida]